MILILYLDYSRLKETPVDFQLFWFLNLFAVAKQAESTGWSGKGHPSKVIIIKFAKLIILIETVFFSLQIRGLSKQATEERRRQFGFGVR